MHSVWRPDNVIRAVDHGIDLFDASYPYINHIGMKYNYYIILLTLTINTYPYILSERGCALIMSLQYQRKKDCLSDNVIENEAKVSQNLLEINLNNKRLQLNRH